MTTKKRPVVRRPPQPTHIHLTLDIGPHLSHLFKRLFPKQDEQGNIDRLADQLGDSSDSLEAAVNANTPK